MSSERTLLIITATTKSEEKNHKINYHHKFTISIQENFPGEFVHLWWQSQMTTNSKISKRIWKFVVITNSQIQLGIWKMRPPDGKSCSAVNYKPSFFGLQHCSYIFNTLIYFQHCYKYIFNTAIYLQHCCYIFNTPVISSTLLLYLQHCCIHIFNTTRYLQHCCRISWNPDTK